MPGMITRTLPRMLLLLLLVLTVWPGSSEGFSSSVVTRTTHNCVHPPQQQPSSCLYAGRKRDADEEEDPDDAAMTLVTKASWYGVELFGKVFGTKQKSSSTAARGTVQYDLTQPPQSFAETVQRIQDDNDREYFLSGQVDQEIYDIDCIFSDPFVSFAGRERFVDNLQNLGSLITQYSARTIPDKKTTKVDDDPPPETNTVTTKVMVKLQLNLPWQPILAWPWGVTYTIDPTTYLITDHQESWEIEPWEGVKQIFRKPTTTIS